MVQIAQCTCKSDFQDRTYGKGMRLMNTTGTDDKVTGYRCTVCGKEYRLSDVKKNK